MYLLCAHHIYLLLVFLVNPNVCVNNDYLMFQLHSSFVITNITGNPKYNIEMHHAYKPIPKAQPKCQIEIINYSIN